MRYKLFLLLLFSLFLFMAGNWVLSITSPDEGKNLEASLRMLESGDFIEPCYNCKPRFEKPPMFYWLTDISFSIFGVNEFSSRFISGISAIGTDILTWLIALEIIEPEAAVISAIVYDTFIHNWVESKSATPEMLLTFFMTLGLFLFVKGRFTLGWFALSLAFLTKGPVGVILPCCVYLLWKRNLKFISLKGIALFFLVGFSWYGAMLYRFGFAYFYKFFIYENILRYTGHKSIHPYPFWYYIPIIGASTLLYLPAIPRVVRNWDRKLNPLLLWFLFVFLFYSLAKNKLHHYVLFLYPPLAVIFASYVGKRYLKAVLIISTLLVLGILMYAHTLEEKRFVPKAVKVIKELKPKNVYFYKIENSAIVFYTRRCIEKVRNLREIRKGNLVITKEGYTKEFTKARVLTRGDEFGKKLVLIQVE
ncbi:glycosyltransferase family 39 protein [Hydrogenivirga sp. 128-5-R1-1]|uniref:ArnT family glycosyltransferase n=1 Tax=Hydrogenivirga sp. 128-5-R1-1 TaxID=392423 RepID=UPI00015EFA48|nr:glycosyltransferase family 39 protein [Hydrogenivirga sp. 128-5-R1-1]EDP75136.1 3-dehydroquinate synthase [Hydrogenivirga sp. 128-5-R1-1]